MFFPLSTFHQNQFEMNDVINQELEFDKKRYKDIITPCCNKNNKDSKFVSFKNHPKQYGYCHSCGVTTLPEVNYETYYNTQKNGNTMGDNTSQNCNTNKAVAKKYIDFKAVKISIERNTNNKLLTYLYAKYPSKKVDDAINLYYIGTSKKGACIFWYINREQKVQKSKHVWYKSNGKRTDYFKVPYKNDDGYKFCLFGEHLLDQDDKPIVLVESEKSAIICSIESPDYKWLAYSGLNGLTPEKIEALSNRQIMIVPDISENAVKAIKKKNNVFKEYNIEHRIIDFTEGKDDDQLKQEGLYNEDVADVFLQDEGSQKQDKSKEEKPEEEQKESKKEQEEPRVKQGKPKDENELVYKTDEQQQEIEEIYQLQKADLLSKENAAETYKRGARELKDDFDKLELPNHPIKLDEANTITNIHDYFNDNLKILEKATDYQTVRIPLNRLDKLKEFLQ